MYQTNENKAEQVLILRLQFVGSRGFVLTQYHKDKTTLSGGIRADNRHINSKRVHPGYNG